MSTVLLIDDEPDMDRLISMCLDDLDVEVVQVSDLPEALDAAQARLPKVVLLDLNLGVGKDGLEMLPDMRAAPALAEVPVIVFSVHSSRMQEALRKGADGFVSKPFKPRQLRAELEPFLSGP